MEAVEWSAFTLQGLEHWITDCAVSGDGTTIVWASNNGTIRVSDGGTGAERFTLSGHTRAVRGCAMSVNGATIVSASDDQTLKVWDGHTGAVRLMLSGHRRQVRGCAVSADGTIIVSASDDRTIKVWDGRTGKCLATLHVDGTLHRCACSADGEKITAAGARGIYFLRLVR